ncbi:amino acid permease, partial [Paenibacillus sp. Aloe-11]
MDLFRKKTGLLPHEESGSTGQLKRTMSAFDLTMLGVGCIIGTGIFVITGKAAAENAGPGLMLSFVIAGIACVLAALCYAELSSTVPAAGSAYAYSYIVFGEILAWVLGWDLILEYGVAAAS